MKVLLDDINTTNQPVKYLDFEEQTRIHIKKLLWYRRSARVRAVIREHIDRIQRWRAGEVGSLGMGFGPRDPCCGDGGMV